MAKVFFNRAEGCVHKIIFSKIVPETRPILPSYAAILVNMSVDCSYLSVLKYRRDNLQWRKIQQTKIFCLRIHHRLIWRWKSVVKYLGEAICQQTTLIILYWLNRRGFDIWEETNAKCSKQTISLNFKPCSLNGTWSSKNNFGHNNVQELAFVLI